MNYFFVGKDVLSARSAPPPFKKVMLNFRNDVNPGWNINNCVRLSSLQNHVPCKPARCCRDSVGRKNEFPELLNLFALLGMLAKMFFMWNIEC